MGRLKVALMGLSGIGADYLAAISSDARLDLLAVADTDPEVVRGHAHPGGPRTYDDYRSLIVEAGPAGLDLLFAALEPFQSAGFMEIAAARRIAVFHKSPLARNTAEARRVLECFAEHDCPLVVPRGWQFEPALESLLNPGAAGGQVYAAAAEVRTTDTPGGWRGDRVRAGGGVLLNGAYDILDLLIHVLGAPETVYARCAWAAVPAASRNYDTEDAAVVSLSFRGDRTASLVAWRGSPVSTWRATFQSTDQTMELCPAGLKIRRQADGAVEEHALQATDPLGSAISAFADRRLSGIPEPPARVREELSTLAVVEAAYLASKTGAPESPGRFLG